jgi:hypothetical protein
MPVEELVQAYVWRWGIQTNFRDEKQIIGVGEAHVRKETSVESLPQFLVATYTMAQLAAMKAFADEAVRTACRYLVGEKTSRGRSRPRRG